MRLRIISKNVIRLINNNKNKLKSKIVFIFKRFSKGGEIIEIFRESSKQDFGFGMGNYFSF